MTVDATSTDANCGNKNGSIHGNATGGTPPYLYSVDKTTFTVSNIFVGFSAGNYWLYAKDAGGGLDSALVTVADPNGPLTAGYVSTPTGCTDMTGSLSVAPYTGTGPYTYSLDNGSFQVDSIFTGLAGGIHTLIVKDTKGCTVTKDAIVNSTNKLTVYAGKDTSVCLGKTITLQASSNASQFTWTGSGITANPFTASPTVTPAVTTKYYVKATAGNCSGVDSVQVTVKPLPFAIAEQGDTICFGKNAKLAGSGGVSASWSPAVFLSSATSYASDVINPTNTIVYQLVVTGANGCISANNATTTISVIPPPAVFAGNDTAIVAGQPLNMLALDVNNSGFNNYSWQPATGLSNPGIPAPVLTLNNANNYVYTVTASTSGGCKSSDTLHINVFTKADIFVANVFTPNGDHNNDILHVKPIGIKNFSNFTVFDRWGERVFYTKDAAIGWDGTIKGRTVPAGSLFVWIAAGTDYAGNLIQRKGTVLIIK